MQTKIRIDIIQGVVEAEGSEEFVKTIYEDFKVRFSEKKGDLSSTKPKIKKTKSKPSNVSKEEVGKKRKTNSKNSIPKTVNDLDLSGKNYEFSLKEFYSQYKVKSNYDLNILFLYYLKNIMKQESVGLDHIFTCYRNIDGIKIPGNVEQSIRDTKIKKSWIDYEKMDNLSLTVHGINRIEHDIEKLD